MTVAVAVHFIVAIIHGAAHAVAHLWLSHVASLFGFAVIIAGPWIGLALMRLARRFGAWVIALTMTGSLVFGLTYHFLVPNPDHVTHVDLRWRSLFATTAVRVGLSEALGCGLAICFARERNSLRTFLLLGDQGLLVCPWCAHSLPRDIRLRH